MNDEARLRALEQRVQALEDARGTGPDATEGAGTAATETRPEDETFWALEGLRRRADRDRGAVLWAGVVPADGGAWEWQMARPADELRSPDDPQHAADRLAALSHPIRLSLLLEVLDGTTRLTDLAERLGLGSTGQLYHHTRALTAAGWLRPGERGHVAIPGERVVPLLVILGASA